MERLQRLVWRRYAIEKRNVRRFEREAGTGRKLFRTGETSQESVRSGRLSQMGSGRMESGKICRIKRAHIFNRKEKDRLVLSISHFISNVCEHLYLEISLNRDVKTLQCSVTCGVGKRQRASWCQVENRVVPRTFCNSMPIGTTEVCDAGPCPQWHSGDWSPVQFILQTNYSVIIYKKNNNTFLL